MKLIKRITLGMLIVCMMMCNVFSTEVRAKNYDKKIYDKTRWKIIKQDYLNSDTDRLIFVKYKSGSKASLEMWKKVPDKETTSTDQTENTIEYSWKKILSCKACVGEKGIYKKKEGDLKTPVGIFNITMAFGRKKSPGTSGISYIKLNKYHYWSAEKATYNTFVDVRQLGRKRVKGEHLIKYNPWYNYSLAMDFNKKCVYRKGSGIFLHCDGGGRTNTLGCVAVSEKNMKKIVKNTTLNTKICIYRK